MLTVYFYCILFVLYFICLVHLLLMANKLHHFSKNIHNQRHNVYRNTVPQYAFCGAACLEL